MRFALFVHSSQQREERTKKRRRGYRAFGFVAAVAVGVCGTRSARTVLALFPPSSLRLHRPIKAESGDLACILTPSPYGHSPYIPLRKHRGRGGLTLLLPLLVFLIPLLVATLLSSPLYFFAPHTAMLRGTAREDCDTKDFLSLPKKVLVTLIRFICSFFLAARKTNQEAPPFLLTPPSLRTPPLYFALQNTGEEGEMYFFALISVKCDTMGGEIAFFFFGI